MKVLSFAFFFSLALQKELIEQWVLMNMSTTVRLNLNINLDFHGHVVTDYCCSFCSTKIVLTWKVQYKYIKWIIQINQFSYQFNIMYGNLQLSFFFALWKQSFDSFNGVAVNHSTNHDNFANRTMILLSWLQKTCSKYCFIKSIFVQSWHHYAIFYVLAFMYVMLDILTE